MAKFTALLSPETIRQGIIVSSKKALLEMAGRLLAEQAQLEDLDAVECFSSLFNREKLGCTAIGNGVAMPRARLPKGDKPVAVFLQLANPIDYDAADNRQVDLILAILVPETLCQQYAAILAELSAKLKDKALDKQLRAAQSAVEIWQIFEYIDKQDCESEQPSTEA